MFKRSRGKRRRGLPSPALVIACVVLFAALGGGAYASGLLGPCGYAVCNAQLGTGSVNARNVKDRSLEQEDFSAAALQGLRAQPNYGAITQVNVSVDVPAGQVVFKVAVCPPGTVVLGGGGEIPQPTPDGNAFVDESFPSNGDGSNGGVDGWAVQFVNASAGPLTGRISASCGPA